MELIEEIKPSFNVDPQSEVEKTERKWGYEVSKRLFDIVFALIQIPFLFPLMALIAILIKIDSKGPIFFSHQRVGKGGKLFHCYKFRTMVVGAHELKADLEHLNEMEGHAFKMKNDPRVTRLGSFLRKYSLDELPQIFNVIKGEMSFVGPRPPLPEEVQNYQPWHRKRLSVTPGITCLWQINGRNEIQSFDDWVRMDLLYIQNSSFLHDLKIILKTVPVVLSRRGAY